VTTVTIELSSDTAERLEREAQKRGIDLPTYVRQLLDDANHIEKPALGATSDRSDPREAPSAVADLPDLDSPEAVVAWIRSHGPIRTPAQEPTGNLADYLRTGGIDPGMTPEEWDRSWAESEAQQKAIDLARSEKTLREIRELLKEDQRAQ
jgi:hypothetical protein